MSFGLIKEAEGLPQLHHPGVVETFPPELIALTDSLHDAGLVDLAHTLLDETTRYTRLLAYCAFILTGEVEG